MAFLTAIEQAFINNGATSAEALAAAEARQNASLMEKIHDKLKLVSDQIAYECFEERLQVVPQLPNRQVRRHALEIILLDIQTRLMFQNLHD